MKTTLFTLLIALPLLNGCVKAEKPEVRVSSNVDEEGRYYPLDGTPITISKAGYVTATFTLTPQKKTRLMSTTSGDDSMWQRKNIFPFSRNDASMSTAQPTVFVSFISAFSSEGQSSNNVSETAQYLEASYAGTTGVAFLPIYTVGFSVPYFAEEYEPAQYYVYLFKEQRDENEERWWQISRFILKNYKSADQNEFLQTLQKMTELNEKTLKEIIKNNPAPDIAANAVITALQQREKQR